MALKTLAQALERRRQPAKQGRHGSRSADFEALLVITDRITSAARLPDPLAIATLTHPEQVVFVLACELDAEVQNGGLHQYLMNSAGDRAQVVRRYLAEVGAPEHLAIMDRVAGVFPDSVIPSQRAERVSILAAAEERDGTTLWGLFNEATAQYHFLKERLYTILMDYVESHRADFVLPDDARVVGG